MRLGVNDYYLMACKSNDGWGGLVLTGMRFYRMRKFILSTLRSLLLRQGHIHKIALGDNLFIIYP